MFSPYPKLHQHAEFEMGGHPQGVFEIGQHIGRVATDSTTTKKEDCPPTKNLFCPACDLSGLIQTCNFLQI
jgi:hypothetical protein